MSSIDELIAKAKADEPKKSDPIEVVIGGEVVSMIFVQADGKFWAETTARYPMRVGVKIDQAYGYNFHAVVMAVSPKTGRQVVDGVEVVLSEKQWQGIYADGVLAGHDFGRIADTVWGLNEWEPQRRVGELKKALAVDSEANSGSPAN